jgi:hypothetical protein
MRKLLLTLVVLLVAAPIALAAKPKLPATFTGGGEGSPVEFRLGAKGAAKRALVAVACKNVDGIGIAKTKDADGKLSKGKIKITYSAKTKSAGTIALTINATFTSKTHAKGTVIVDGPKCKGTPSKHAFTADAR